MSRGNIKQIAIKSEITYLQLLLTGILQVHINRCPGGPGVMPYKVQERIKRGSRICIQERLPQAGLAGLANGYVQPFVIGVPITAFPAPSLEVIADPSQLAA